MAMKIRKQVYLEPRQEALLKRLAAELNVTEAELIRQAIDRQTRFFRSPERDLAAWEEEKAFITHLIEQGPVPGERTWQREALHER